MVPVPDTAAQQALHSTACDLVGLTKLSCIKGSDAISLGNSHLSANLKKIFPERVQTFVNRISPTRLLDFQIQVHGNDGPQAVSLRNAGGGGFVELRGAFA